MTFCSYNYTRGMSYTRAQILSILSLLAGGFLLVYVLRNLSPYSEGDRLNPAALLAFVSGVFLVTSSVGVLAALVLHRRWPVLAGRKVRQRRQPLIAAPALRQGILVGLTAVTLLALAITQVLDIAVLIVTLLVAGLIEAYVQSRQA